MSTFELNTATGPGMASLQTTATIFLACSPIGIFSNLHALSPHSASTAQLAYINYGLAGKNPFAFDPDTSSIPQRPLVRVAYENMDTLTLSPDTMKSLEAFLSVVQEFAQYKPEVIDRICVGWYDPFDPHELSVTFMLPNLNAQQAMVCWRDVDEFIRKKLPDVLLPVGNEPKIFTNVRWGLDAATS